MLVYMATNRINGKEYVGLTTKELDKRVQDHIWAAINNKTNMYFHKAIRKYCIENFDWEILHDGITNIDDLNKLEIYYIDLYDTFNNGYNSTIGGGTTTGWSPSQETRDKIGVANKGRKQPPRTQEYKDAVSKKFKGKKHSKEHIEKNRQAKLGSRPNVSKEVRVDRALFAYKLGKRKRTKQEVNQMKASLTGVNHKHSGYVVITPDSMEIDVPCMRAFCRGWTEEKLIPQNMSSVAKGKRKYHKGYQCFYKENYNG